MKLIKLTQGKSTIVDDENYEKLVKYHWVVLIRREKKGSGRLYVVRRESTGTLNGKTIYLHRHIKKITDHDLHVHHINGNPLDNREKNLQVLTAREHHQAHK